MLTLLGFLEARYWILLLLRLPHGTLLLARQVVLPQGIKPGDLQVVALKVYLYLPGLSSLFGIWEFYLRTGFLD